MTTTLKFSILFFFATINSLLAQINLDCNGSDMHSIYGINQSGIYRVDSIDSNPGNPVLVTTAPVYGGISINSNLDSTAGPQTMYAVGNGGPYYYWNGTGWTNTNHFCQNTSAINIGGTTDYIFNYSGTQGLLYRYDGTGNDTLLVSGLNAAGSSIYDVATDNQGNFYLFFTTSQMIISFTPAGLPVDTFTTSGFPTGTNPGFALLGNKLYAIASGGNLYEGIQTGNAVNFSLIKNLGISFLDIAACPGAGNPLTVSENSVLPHFAICPNPFNEELTVSSPQSAVSSWQLANNKTEIKLFDIYGRTVLSQPLTTANTKLQTSNLSNGIYFVTIFTGNKVITHKVVKVK